MSAEAPFSESIVHADMPCSIAELLPRAAREHPGSGIHVDPDDGGQEPVLISYRALLEESRRILGGLKARGIESGARITLLLERPRDFLPTFWACVMGGYIPCPLAPIRNDPQRWAAHLAHIGSLLGRPLCISEGELLHELPESVASVALGTLREGPPHRPLHEAEASDPAILMLTSGSTGNSKAVELSHGNLLASLAGRKERQQLSATDTMFNWIAFDHVAALLESHMIALYACAKQVHVQPSRVLTDPLQFLEIIHRFGVTVAFAPNFLLGQVNAALQTATAPGSGRALTLDLSRLRRIVTGGEANVVETGVRFLDLLAPYGLRRTALWPAFGMTETCAACVYSHEFPELDANREFAAVGLPIDGLEWRIADERGKPQRESQPGELQLRGPMIFRRYYNNEEATGGAFTRDGWFRTGDVGRVDAGRLRLLARNKDSIIVSGVNYFSHELETRIEQLEGVERSYVAAFPIRPSGADTEQLVVTFATSIPADDEDALYRLVLAARNTTIMLWGFRPALILPLPQGAFPKTSLGKIQRSLMRKRLEAGELDAEIAQVAELARRQTGAYLAPAGGTEHAIAELYARILGVDPGSVSAAASFFDLGGTSLDILKLTQALRRGFGLEATVPVVLQNPTVKALAACVASGGRAQKYDPVVPLQTTGRKTPLFCVHPGNGEIFVLVNVAKYFFNDRPFYALRPPGFNQGEAFFATADEMVKTYVDSILRRQDRGPYAIAGYSLGCVIAFEVAKELEARGHEVRFLGCIDYWPGFDPKPLGFNMATGLAIVLDLIDKEQFARLNQTLGPQEPTNEVCAQILQLASAQRLAELDLDLQKFAAWARVAHAVETVWLPHATRGRARDMTVFCSEGIGPRYTETRWSRSTWGQNLRHWDDFAGHVRYVEVPGTHHMLMGPQFVATFQALLRAEIDRSMGDGSPQSPSR